jgi:hypothetical protein
MTKEWALAGDTGTPETVDIRRLLIDHSYQRGEVSRRGSEEMARAFNWSSFGTVTVMQRSNGNLYIVDGQQRVAAAKLREDITRVPCLIFRSLGVDHEARAFLAMNSKRRPVSSADKYRAAVMCGEPLECDLDRWLQENGFTVELDQLKTSPKNIRFIAVLLRTWKWNKESSKAALLAQVAVLSGEPLHGHIHAGMYWLEVHGVSVIDHADKLILTGGKTAILGVIKAEHLKALHFGRGENKASLNGMAILTLINKGKRGRKVRLTEKHGITNGGK